MNEEITRILNDVVEDLQSRENEAFRLMAFMNKHKFEIEREAIRYKQEAYNRSWREVACAIEKIKKLTK